MEPILFDGLTPQKYIWVSPTGNDFGTGSEGSPLKTIQAAVKIATAGTAIMVTAGVYHENVKLPTNAAGTPENPIWLISADGPQAAKVVAVDQSLSTIYGLGTDNYVVSGFEIEGGFRGIQFSQSGSSFTNMVSNIVVTGNLIHDTKEDGIKIGQADNAYVVGNTIIDVAEEGIDFLAVNNGVIAYNEVSNAKSTAAGIFAKGGSTGVVIHHNYVHDIPLGDGICIGGQTEPTFFRPGYTTYEARNVLVTDNYIEDVARRPVNVKGAIDSKILDNYLAGNPDYYAAIAIQMGASSALVPMYSANIEIADNILIGNRKIVVNTGNNNNISIHDNAPNGQWTIPVGPNAYFETGVENRTPTGITLSAEFVKENASGVLIGTLSAVDPDAYDSHTFVLKSDPSNCLEIVGRELRLKPGASLDFEATPELLVEIETSDASGAVFTKAVKIAVTDVRGVTLNGNGRDNTIAGAAEADTLDGRGGNDTLNGGAGADLLIGGSGNDVLDGAAGSDIAAYSGTFSNYSVVQKSDGSWSIVDLRSGSPDGTDKLWNVELLQFSDALKTLSASTQSPPPPPPSTPTPPGPGNAAPVIISADANGVAAEWADNSPNETANTPHTASGSVIYADADALDLHTAAFTPKGSGYLGAFSLNTAAIDSADTVAWSFAVSDSAMEALKAGQTKTQLYSVTIDDGHGGTIAQTITIALTGADDAVARVRRARGNDPDSAPDSGPHGSPSEGGRHHDRHGDHQSAAFHPVAPDLATLLGVHDDLHT
jgi:VCBS repeat-containing protein